MVPCAATWGFYNNLLTAFLHSCTARVGGHQLVHNFYRCETRLLKIAVSARARQLIHLVTQTHAFQNSRLFSFLLSINLNL